MSLSHPHDSLGDASGGFAAHYVSTEVAARSLSCTPDHIARLCRSGELAAVRVGKTWKILEDSLSAYKESLAEKKQELKEKLSETRKQEYQAKPKFLSTEEAARKADCTSDHIARICRSGDVACVRVGTNWYVRESSLLQHLALIEARKEEQRARLAEERRRQYQEERERAKPMYPVRSLLKKARSVRVSAILVHGIACAIVAGYGYALVMHDFDRASLVRSLSAQNLSSLAAASASDSLFSRIFSPVLEFFSGPSADIVELQVSKRTIPPKAATQAPERAASVPLSPREQTIVQNITNNFSLAGVSSEELKVKLEGLSNALRQEITKITGAPTPSRPPSSGGITNVIALTQKIDQLAGVTISGGSITGAAISGGSIDASALSGPVAISKGGTGTSSAPSYGQVLVGNIDGGYDLVATSSFGGGSGTVNTGTAGQLAYYESSGTAVSGTSTLTLSSTQRVGVGTSSPLSRLDVYGDAILSGISRYLNFGDVSGSSGYGIRDNAGTLEFKNNSGGWTGFGTGSGGQSWEISNGALAPTTTLGIVVSASSTFTGGLSIGNSTTTNATTTNLAVSGTASTSNLVISNGLTFKNVTGFLKATAGAVATSLIDLASDVGTSILAIANGGTGWANIQANTLLLGNGTSRLATTSAGTNGQTLALVSGVPTWVATTTYSSGLTYSGGNVTLDTVTVARGGTGTTTAPAGWVLYGGGNGIYQARATTTASCSGSVSCSSFDIFGDTPVTLSSSALTSYDAFTHPTFWGQTTSATSTALRLTGSPFSLFASSTGVFQNASTTQFTTTDQWFTGLSGGGLAVDASGKVYAGATSTLSTISGTLATNKGGTATTTFYNGGVVFYNSTLGTLSQASAQGSLFYNNTTGRLGIGTSSPQNDLHIESQTTNAYLTLGTPSGTTGALLFQASGNQRWQLGRDGTNNDDFFLYNYGLSTNALTAKYATNYIGIGTSSPWGQLSVNPNGISGPSFVVGSSSATSFLVDNGGRVGVGTTTPASTFAVSGSSYISTNLTVETGNVGIGAPSSGQPLEVVRNQNANTYVSVMNTNTSGAARTGLLLCQTAACDSLNYGILGHYGSGWTTDGVQVADRTALIGYDTSGLLLAAGGDAPVVFGTRLFAGSGFSTSNERMRIAADGNVGIGTTSPYAKLSVVGQTVSAYFTATTSQASTFPYASSTAFSSTYASSTQGFFGSLSIGSLSGFLKATAGAVATALIDLANDVAGILAVLNGGTGWGEIQANSILLGNGTSRLATTSAGTNGQTLALVSGVPTWVATTTFSSGLSYSGGNVTNTGVLSIAQTYGSAQTGALTLATSSATSFNGLSLTNAITNSGTTFTVAPNTITGTLNVIGGGTGLSSLADGSLIFGSGGSTFSTLATTSGAGRFLSLDYTTGRPSWVATSSLGVAISDTTGTLAVSRGGTGQTSFGQGWLGINDSGAFISSTSPTVNYLTATSTTQRSSFASGLTVSGTTGGYYIDNNLVLQASTTMNSTAVGYLAGVGFTSASTDSTAVGYEALRYASSSAQYNTAIGVSALRGSSSNFTGDQNVAVGTYALQNVTTGYRNIGVGYNALNELTIGDHNTAVGYYVLHKNTTGVKNTGIGNSALFWNVSGLRNTALGNETMVENRTGNYNVAVGSGALNNNRTGEYNIALGSDALALNKSATNTVAIGYAAGFGDWGGTTASENNVFVGFQSATNNTTGNNNTFVGYRTGDTLTTGSNNILLGYDIDTPAVSTNNFLSIGNLIFGNNIDGTGTTLSSGSIGIGTTSPWAKFAVNPVAGNTNQFVVGSSTATSFIINNAGRVGVGTTTPGGLFAVEGSANFAAGTSATSSIYSNLAISGRVLLDNGQDIFWRGSGGSPASVLELSGDTTFLRGGGGTPTLRIDNSTGTNLMTFLEGGAVGVASSSPWAKFAVNPVAGDTNQFVVGSSTATSFVIDNAGRFGFGAPSPADKLFVYAPDNQTTSLYFADNGSTSGGGIKYEAGGNLIQLFGRNSGTDTDALTIVRTTGDVGINDSGPDYRLETVGSSGNGYFGITNSSNGDIFTVNASGLAGIASSSPWALLSVNPNGISGPAFAVGSSTATNFVITNAGRVGIGTAAPGEKFELSASDSSVYASSGSTAVPWTEGSASVLRVSNQSTTNDSAAYLNLYARNASSLANHAYIGVVSNSGVYVPDIVIGQRTGSASYAERMRIDSSGNVGIGTSTLVASAKLDIYGDGILSGSNRYLNFGDTNGSSGYGFRDNAGTLEFKNSGGVWNSVNTATTGPAFNVNKNSVSQSVTADTTTQITWAAEEFDTNNNFDLSTERFTPTVAGKYIINLRIRCTSGATRCDAQIRKNGTEVARSIYNNNVTLQYVDVTHIVDMNGTTDYIDAATFISGSTTQIEGTVIDTKFSGALIAPTYAYAGGWSNDGTQSFLADSTDKVGVGTSSPWAKLAVDAPAGMNAFTVGSSTTYFHINQNGKVGIGTQNPTPTNDNTVVPSLVVSGAGATGSGFQLVRHTTVGAGGAQLFLAATRGSDANSYTALQNADGIGTITFSGSDGSQFISAAGIQAVVNGSVSTNNVLGDLKFLTSAGGANTLVEHMRITSSGNVGIGTSTPNRKLNVLGSAIVGSSATGAGVLLQTNGSVGEIAGINHANNTYNALQLSTGASPSLYINTSGNVGIGTTNPDSRAQITGGGLCVGSDANCNTDNNTEGVVYSSATSMTVYDVAENYPTRDMEVEPADIVALDPENAVFVKKADSTSDRILGVISGNPAVLLGGFNGDQFPDERQVAVGLSGRILVKVSLEGGSIAIGDYLSLSSEPGVAKKAADGEQSIGYALENYTAPTESNQIQFFITLSTFSDFSLADLTEALEQEPTPDSPARAFLTNLFAQITQWLADAGNGIAKLFAREVHTETLCITKSDGGDVCVTGDQLAALLAGTVSASTTGNPASGQPTADSGQQENTPDTEAPVITILGNNPATIEVGSTYADLGASVIDDQDTNLGIHIYQWTVNSEQGTEELQEVQNVQIDTSVPGEHTIIYRATDQAGNTGEATRTVIVGEQSTANSEQLEPTPEEPQPEPAPLSQNETASSTATSTMP